VGADDGAITGTIEDATRHVLAGVKLSVRHLETGMSRTTQTSSEGRYLIPAAAPGEYERIRAEMPVSGHTCARAYR
jgi:hypothetical protein